MAVVSCSVVNLRFAIVRLIRWARCTLYLVGIVGIVGFIFGIFAYKNGIPPRWFWSKSADEIFSFSVTAVLGYAVNFAMWPCAIYLVQVLVEKCSAV